MLHHGNKLSNHLGMLLITEEIATYSMADDQNVYVQRGISNSLWIYPFHVTRSKRYFSHDINGGGVKVYTADNICKMIELLIDNISVQFGGCFSQLFTWD